LQLVRKENHKGDRLIYLANTSANGNRLERIENGASISYDYDGHQMILAGTSANSYDANGNQLTRKGWTPQWDAQNRLIQMPSANGNTTLTFTYDPFNRRIEKKCVTTNRRRTTTTTTQYVYDGEDIVLQKETIAYVSGRAFTTKTRFIHGPGIDEPLAMIEGRDTYYYHADGSGSIVAMTDEHAKIVQHYNYDSFGMPTISDSDFSQPYTYTGREWDKEIGLYYYRARYYNPSAGRFISKDPIGFNGGDVTLYGYVGNNPVNYVDPSGKVLVTGTAVVLSGLAVTGAAAAPVAEDIGKWLGNIVWNESNEGEQCGNALDDYPADPDKWHPPEGWTETPAGQKTGG